MVNGLRTQARRVLLWQVAPAYRCASASQKQHILEEFVGATGYAPRYARWLLNHTEEVFEPPTALRRQYGPEVEEALVLVWNTLNRFVSNASSPSCQIFSKPRKRKGMYNEAAEHRSLLLSMSAATADRLLQAQRYTHRHVLATTKADPLLKQQIPIRTFGKSGRDQTGLVFRSIWSLAEMGECRVAASI